jgi:predicted nucleic acid-binding protein
MLNFFYECTLIVLRTTNIDIYLRFQIFDAIFNYFEYLKKTIEINICFSIKIVTRTCNKVSKKLAKYYSKIKELNNTLYNFVNILNSTQKLSFYKM